MFAQKLAHRIPIDRVDLEALDRFLMSDRSPLGEHDAVRSRRLPHRDRGRAGTGPAERMAAADLGRRGAGVRRRSRGQGHPRHHHGLATTRFSDRSQDDALEPVFWADRDGTLIAADWADGFLQAIMLRMDAWDRLFKSKRDGQLLFPILALCGDENGESLLGLPPDEEDRVMEEMTEFIPSCVTAIAAYWREKGPKQISMPLTADPPSRPDRASTKVGRNDPCPCGSGKKFKKCCGKNR